MTQSIAIILSFLLTIALPAFSQGDSWGGMAVELTNRDLLSVAFGSPDVGNAGTIPRTTDGQKRRGESVALGGTPPP